MNMQIVEFAEHLADSFGAPTAAEITAVTSFEVKKHTAVDVLRATAAHVYRLDGNDIDAIAAIAANPDTRDVAHEMIGSRPFRNPATTWASESVTPTLDYLFGDRAPSSRGAAVVIPAGWSVEVWAQDSDLDDGGTRRYAHWMAGRLPSVVRPHGSRPLRVVWLSGHMYGTVTWGASEVHLIGRNVHVAVDPVADCFNRVDATV